jgi:hypothetical protein
LKRKVKEKKVKKLYATKFKKGTCDIMASGREALSLSLQKCELSFAERRESVVPMPRWKAELPTKEVMILNNL